MFCLISYKYYFLPEAPLHHIIRKQFTIAKFANHNFILVHISNSIGVIIPNLVKKQTNSIFISLWRFNLINCRAN